MCYIITYFIGYPLNHHFHQDASLYDLDYFVYCQNLIFNHRLRGAVHTINEHDSCHNSDHIGHVSNIQVSLRHYISATIVYLMQQNPIIMVELVTITQGHTHIIILTLYVAQQAQVIKDMVNLKKKKKKKKKNYIRCL